MANTLSVTGSSDIGRIRRRNEDAIALMPELGTPSPGEAGGLPAEQREVWRAFFDHFVFQRDGDPADHLPDDLQDVMGKLSQAERDQVIAYVVQRQKG